jgi:hypothetical protein
LNHLRTYLLYDHQKRVKMDTTGPYVTDTDQSTEQRSNTSQDSYLQIECEAEHTQSCNTPTVFPWHISFLKCLQNTVSPPATLTHSCVTDILMSKHTPCTI